MRLLRWMELALALGMLALLLIAGPLRPPSFHPLTTPRPTTAVEAGTTPARPLPTPVSSGPGVRPLLDRAATRHNLDPLLVEAVSYWESGWDQSRVSVTGAVGLMQVQPEVADDLAPRLLGRRVDIHRAGDNAELGAAILRAYIDDQGGDVNRGLAAYYQGPQSIRDDGVQPETQGYVDGIEALRQLLAQGSPLPPPPG